MSVSAVTRNRLDSFSVLNTFMLSVLLGLSYIMMSTLRPNKTINTPNYTVYFTNASAHGGRWGGGIMRPDNEMDFLADFLVLRMMASICTSCKCDISSFVYLCNKRDRERERAASRPWPTSRGPLSRAHFSSITAGSKKKKKRKSVSLGDWRREQGGLKMPCMQDDTFCCKSPGVFLFSLQSC